MLKPLSILKDKRIVFWDFDGVIKDSIEVKTLAYESLFKHYGLELSMRVRKFHEDNGGVSRFDKIPLFLNWAGESADLHKVKLFCDRFSQSVVQAVIDSPWVLGAREYLLNHYRQQCFVLVTATPQAEIEQILISIGLFDCFRMVSGSPTSKKYAIENALKLFNLPPSDALLIGDSETDLMAAKATSIRFLLRRTQYNVPLHHVCNGAMLDHFNDE